jgi:DNA-directed RNA polymerase alpha subunit
MRIEIKLTDLSVEETARLQREFPEKVRVTGLCEEAQTFEALLKVTTTELFRFLSAVYDTTYEQKLYTKIEELKLSSSTKNCLHRANILYIGDLIQENPFGLKCIRGFGEMSLSGVQNVLAHIDLCLGTNLENFPDPEVVKRLYGEG